MAVAVFMKSVEQLHRVPVTAIYLTSNRAGIPPALLHNLKYNMIVHERVVLLTAETALTPTVSEENRVQTTDLGSGFTRIVVRHGFMESADLPAILAGLAETDASLRPDRAIYFLSRQTLLPSSRPGMALWRERLFALMTRNAETSMTFFKLPVHRVVELGNQVEI